MFSIGWSQSGNETEKDDVWKKKKDRHSLCHTFLEDQKMKVTPNMRREETNVVLFQEK